MTVQFYVFYGLLFPLGFIGHYKLVVLNADKERGVSLLLCVHLHPFCSRGGQGWEVRSHRLSVGVSISGRYPVDRTIPSLTDKPPLSLPSEVPPSQETQPRTSYISSSGTSITVPYLPSPYLLFRSDHPGVPVFIRSESLDVSDHITLLECGCVCLSVYVTFLTSSVRDTKG